MARVAGPADAARCGLLDASIRRRGRRDEGRIAPYPNWGSYKLEKYSIE